MGRENRYLEIVLLGTLLSGGCIAASDDTSGDSSDDGVVADQPFWDTFEGCRTCQNGFAEPIPTAGVNDLQAAFNYVHGSANSCSQAPQNDEERADACSAWGAVVTSTSGAYDLWVSTFSNTLSGTPSSCPAGTTAAYYVRWDASAGQCDYEYPSATAPAGTWYIKCVEILTPLTTPHDYACS